MDNISDKLMELSIMLQDSDEETKLMFAQIFELSRKMAEKGITVQQLQMLVIVGHQVSQNPELKQMYQYLFNMTKFNPNDTFH
jgi:GTP-sensing pleiotropic transcriptional regulator CodY